MRCPRCESSNGDDFFQNKVRQSRSVGGGDVLEGGLGSFEFDSQFWTCKKCMVRCISDKEFEEQKWQASLLNMTPEEKEVAYRRKVLERAQEAKRAQEAQREEMKNWNLFDWAMAGIGTLLFFSVVAGIWYLILNHFMA